MSKLLQSIVTVIDIFYQYANQDGECDMLNKAELKELLENEFGQILKNPDDPDTVDIIMQNLDQDHNKKVEFTEYLLMIFKLTRACNKIVSKDYCQASGSKQRGHSHQDQEEQSETEEDEGQKSSSSNLSWREGENDSHSRGSRGSIRHRSRSSSRITGHQGGLSSSGDRQSSRERRRESNSGHSKGSKKNKHGSHQHKRSRSEEGVVEDKATGQIQMSLLVMVMAVAQASLLRRHGMNPMKDINQEIVKNKETVLLLVRVRYLVMANTGQAQDTRLAVSNMGLDQVNPLAMDNTDLAQVSLLALVTTELA
ncbi:filaggrin-2-like [Muntiacus reevesi]|uniref:filaggrin-2-like n=1 Tax=Muntiacus reevesi TaxID=9886 RepID=UPI003307C0CC